MADRLRRAWNKGVQITRDLWNILTGQGRNVQAPENPPAAVPGVVGGQIATGKTGGTKPPKKTNRRTTITQGVADIVQGKMPGGPAAPAGAGLPADIYGIAGSTRIRTATSPAGGRGATAKAGGKGATKKAGGKGATAKAGGKGATKKAGGNGATAKAGKGKSRSQQSQS